MDPASVLGSWPPVDQKHAVCVSCIVKKGHITDIEMIRTPADLLYECIIYDMPLRCSLRPSHHLSY